MTLQGWVLSNLVSFTFAAFLPVLLFAQFAQAQQEAWMTAPPTSTGIGVGQKIPGFRTVDQFGQMRDFNSIRGPKGAAIVFNRSADW